jgi:hypothetical protein
VPGIRAFGSDGEDPLGVFDERHPPDGGVDGFGQVYRAAAWRAVLDLGAAGEPVSEDEGGRVGVAYGG